MEARFGVRDRFDQRDIRAMTSFSMSFAYPVVPTPRIFRADPCPPTTAASLPKTSIVSAIGLPLRELIHLGEPRRARSFEISTALVEVDPPSIPTKLRQHRPERTSQGKMPPPIFSLEGCQLGRHRRQPPPPSEHHLRAAISLNVIFQVLPAAVDADVLSFGFAKLYRSERREY